MALTFLLVAAFVFNLIAIGLAFAAEWWKSTGAPVNGYCVYHKNIATPLGISAFLLLLFSQSITMIATRCLCCGKAMRPSRSRTWAIVQFITCWVFFFIAEACLLAGSVRNAYHTKYVPVGYSCKMLRKGVFSAGAIFISLTSLAAQLYVINYAKVNDGQTTSAREAGISMGNI